MTQAVQKQDTLGLYLSVPFCQSKCTFCNFASGVYPASDLPRYVSRLVAEIASARLQAEDEHLVLPDQVDTLYFGGGTPSILSPAQLATIFAAIRQHFTLVPGAEITLEAAPALLPDDLLAAAVELGVTRISFGVQTFVDAEARATGRLHTASQALADLARVRRAGLQASVDLIAGLPGQTEASWQHSLATLVDAAPEHASIYMLEVDRDSRLGSELLLGGTRYGAGLTPSDDAVADFYSEACHVLAAAGLRQYEISNFARPGHESRHNLRYWQRRPYLGLGLDAHSMLRTPAGQPVRFGTPEVLAAYLDGQPETAQQGRRRGPWRELHAVTPAEELEEAWFLGLRCIEGVSLGSLREEFGRAALDACCPILNQLAADGLLTLQAGRAALTDCGRMLSNDVFAGFLGIDGTCLEAAEMPALASPGAVR